MGWRTATDDFRRRRVDRALSHIYASPDFPKLYTKWFGEYDDKTDTFFQWITIPD